MSQKSKLKSTTDFMNEFNEGAEEMENTPSAETTENFASLLSDSFKSSDKRLKVGDKIKGKILILGREDVYLTTGTRFDGVLSRRELNDADGNCSYKEGDILEIYVTMVKGNEIKLSKNPTDRNMAEDLISAYRDNLAIQGRIVEVCKGGVRVNIKGKMAFCPISQIDSKHIETAEEYVGRSFDFKITEISEGGKNIVVSRRKLLDTEREAGTAHFLSETKDGDVVTGRVTRLETFGAFVELAPGVEGLVHISEISWNRIGAPSEVLTPGQDVTVKLLKRELLNGRAKLSLSIKQITPREEQEKKVQTEKNEAFQKFSIGQTFNGKVTRKEPYGLFIQIEPGVNGLLHKSRTETNREFQFDKIRVGDSINVQIVEIKSQEKQIALGLPGDESENDWKNYKPANTTASLGTLAGAMQAALAKKK
jgi:small subunit ribosomal protein S1